MAGKISDKNCFVCGKSLWNPVPCRKCGEVFCPSHSSPSKHNCPALTKRSWKKHVIILMMILFTIAAVSIFWVSRTGRDKPIWWRVYGGNNSGTALCILKAVNGYLLGGIAGEDSSFLMMINREGEQSWYREYVVQSFQDMIRTDDGFLFLGNTAPGTIYNQPALVKVDGQGNTLWSHIPKFAADPEYANKVVAIVNDGEGGYICAGEISKNLDSDCDIHIWGFTEEGDKSWEKTLDREGEESASCINKCSDGFLVTGWAEQSDGSRDIVLIKIDTEGEIIWQRTINHPGDESPYATICLGDEEYLVAGDWDYLDENKDSGIILRTNSEGEKIWVTSISEESCIRELLEVRDGCVAVGWITLRETVPDPQDPSRVYDRGYNDVYVTKIDPDGAIVWERRYGGNRNDRGYSTVSGDSCLIISGATTSYRDRGTTYVLKVPG